jgi:hypothetical protein
MMIPFNNMVPNMLGQGPTQTIANNISQPDIVYLQPHQQLS